MLLSLVLHVFLVLPSTVHAWGGLGHRTVAYLAEKYLTDEAQCMVDSLLDNSFGWDISDAATWADKSVRRRRPETKQWHYIDANDNPPKFCGVQFKRDCNKNGTPGCVVSAIVNMTEILKAADADETSQREALMFLIHFIGDVHQPLHTELLDRGGNDIHTCFDNSCGRVNLHSVWDTFIPTKSRGGSRHPNPYKERKAAALWANELYGSYSNGSLGEQKTCDDIADAQACALEWASESNAWVCEYVLERGVDWIKSHDLGGTYFERAVPIVDSMITKAGMRLGAWLNELAAHRNESCTDHVLRQPEDPLDNGLDYKSAASLELR